MYYNVTIVNHNKLVTKDVGNKWYCWLESDSRVKVMGSTEQEAIDNMMDVLERAELISNKGD